MCIRKQPWSRQTPLWNGTEEGQRATCHPVLGCGDLWLWLGCSELNTRSPMVPMVEAQPWSLMEGSHTAHPF